MMRRVGYRSRPTVWPLLYRPTPGMLLYGFRSCDMVRGAMKWLDAAGLAYTFVDYRREPLRAEVLDDWCARAGWETVFNRNSTAFRKLSPEVQSSLTESVAKSLIHGDTNFIKRPLLDTGSAILVGFNAERWAAARLQTHGRMD